MKFKNIFKVFAICLMLLPIVNTSKINSAGYRECGIYVNNVFVNKDGGLWICGDFAGEAGQQTLCGVFTGANTAAKKNAYRRIFSLAMAAKSTRKILKIRYADESVSCQYRINNPDNNDETQGVWLVD